MPSFTPPTMPQALSTKDRLFSRYTIPVGLSVVKRGGVFRTVPFPALAEVASLTEGLEWFQGGRTYVVDDATATALAADGFTVIADAGYGVGPYGSEGYGF